MRIIGRRVVAMVGAVALSFTGLLATGGTASAAGPGIMPSCTAFQSHGPDGTVHVQINPSGKVTWAVTMFPKAKSVGAWHLFTMMGGVKTRSGFNRVVTGPYVPHGTVSETRPGLVFSVRGWIDSGDGSKYFVRSDDCLVPG